MAHAAHASPFNYAQYDGLVNPHYAGALPSSRQKLVHLHCKWYYTLTEARVTDRWLEGIYSKAESYKERMQSALNDQADQANVGNPAVIKRLGGEATFAHAFLLELSVQAAAFRRRLNDIQTTLRLLAVETDLIYAQIDEEMGGRPKNHVTVIPGKQLHPPAV